MRPFGLLLSLPESFPAALDFLMRKSGVTTMQLAERSGLSDSTITRLRTRDSGSYKMDQAVILCIALHLPPWLSGEMLYKA